MDKKVSVLVSQGGDVLLVMSVLVQLLWIRKDSATTGWSRTSAFLRAFAVLLRYNTVFLQYSLLMEKMPVLFENVSSGTEFLSIVMGDIEVYRFLLKIFLMAAVFAIVYQFALGVKACDNQASADSNFFASFAMAFVVTVGIYFQTGSPLDVSLFSHSFFVSFSYVLEAFSAWAQLAYNSGCDDSNFTFGNILSVTLVSLSKFISLLMFKAEMKGNLQKMLNNVQKTPSTFSIRLSAFIIVCVGLAYILLALSKARYFLFFFFSLTLFVWFIDNDA